MLEKMKSWWQSKNAEVAVPGVQYHVQDARPAQRCLNCGHPGDDHQRTITNPVRRPCYRNLCMCLDFTR